MSGTNLSALNVITNNPPSQAPVARTCNPNYSGGRDQEDGGSNPSLGK
jgi:hypothetical protein